jgi:hypothetical protein
MNNQINVIRDITDCNLDDSEKISLIKNFVLNWATAEDVNKVTKAAGTMNSREQYEKLLDTAILFKGLAVTYLKAMQKTKIMLDAYSDPDFEATDTEIAVATKEWYLYRMFVNDILNRLTGEYLLYENTDLDKLIEDVSTMQPFQ